MMTDPTPAVSAVLDPGNARKQHCRDDVHMRQTGTHVPDQGARQGHDSVGDGGDVAEHPDDIEQGHGDNREGEQPFKYAHRNDLGRKPIDQDHGQAGQQHPGADRDAKHQEENHQRKEKPRHLVGAQVRTARSTVKVRMPTAVRGSETNI